MRLALAVVPPMSKERRLSKPVCRATRAAATTPAAGPELDRHHRHGHRLVGLQDAAVGAHDVKWRQALLARRRVQLAQVGGEDRPDVGAHRRGAGALELLHLGQHLRGEVDRNARQTRAQPLAQPPLVLRVEEAEQQAHRHRLRAGLLQCGDQAVHLVLGERHHDAAVRSHPLRDLEAAAARDQSGGCVLKQVVEVPPSGAAQLEHVTEAARGHESGARPFLLQDCVGDDGGGMRQQADVGCGNAVAVHRGRQCREHALGRDRAGWSAPWRRRCAPWPRRPAPRQ